MAHAHHFDNELSNRFFQTFYKSILYLRDNIVAPTFPISMTANSASCEVYTVRLLANNYSSFMPTKASAILSLVIFSKPSNAHDDSRTKPPSTNFSPGRRSNASPIPTLNVKNSMAGTSTPWTDITTTPPVSTKSSKLQRRALRHGHCHHPAAHWPPQSRRRHDLHLSH
jgi:hypothetical protein